MLEDLEQRYSELRQEHSYLQDTGLQLLTIYTFLIIVSGLYSAGFVNLEVMGAVTALVLLTSYRADLGEINYERKTVLGVLGAVTLLGFVLRIHNLGVQSMWFDETITANAAKAVLEHGKPVFPSGMEYWRAYPHTLMAALSAKLLGFTDFALRLPSVLIGTATIPLTYIAGKELFDRETGLIAALMISFATWEIAWSRQARMYPLLQMTYLATVVLTHRISRDFDYRDTALLAGTFVLAALTHPIAYILPPIATTYIVLEKLQYLEDLEKYVQNSIKPLTALVLVALAASALGQNYISIIQKTLSMRIDHLPVYHNWLKNQLSTLYLLSITGLTIPFLTDKRKQGLLILLATAPAIYVLTFHVKLTASRYLYFTLPFLTILTAQTLKTTSNYITQKTQIDRKTLTALITITTILIAPNFTTTPQTQYQLGINAPQPDFKTAYQYIQNNSTGNETLITGWTAPALHYHRAPDYWLQFSLTGIGMNWENNGTEIYSGAKVIGNSTQLNKTISEFGEIYIVLDARAFARQSQSTKNLLRNLETAYESDQIKVYSKRGEVNQ